MPDRTRDKDRAKPHFKDHLLHEAFSAPGSEQSKGLALQRHQDLEKWGHLAFLWRDPARHKDLGYT